MVLAGKHGFAVLAEKRVFVGKLVFQFWREITSGGFGGKMCFCGKRGFVGKRVFVVLAKKCVFLWFWRKKRVFAVLVGKRVFAVLAEKLIFAVLAEKTYFVVLAGNAFYHRIND